MILLNFTKQDKGNWAFFDVNRRKAPTVVGFQVGPKFDFRMLLNQGVSTK